MSRNRNGVTTNTFSPWWNDAEPIMFAKNSRDIARKRRRNVGYAYALCGGVTACMWFRKKLKKKNYNKYIDNEIK